MNLINLNIKAIKNLSVYGLGQAVNIISPLLITPYLIAICGLEKFGIVAIGQSLAFIFIVIVDYSSNIEGVKNISINRKNKLELENIYTTIFTSKLILLLIVVLIFLALTFFIPYFYDERRTILFSITIIIGQFLNPTWFFQGLENFKGITFINVFSKVIYVLGVLFFINTPEDYIFANFWLGLGLILSSIFALISIQISCNFNFFKVKFSQVKQYLNLDLDFCVSQLFLAIRNYSSVIIIGFVGGDLIAGQFKVIEQIINLFRTYLQMFFKFSFSYVCFEIDNNVQKGILLWKKYNVTNLFILVFLLLFVFVFAEEMLLFFHVKANLKIISIYLKTALLIPFLIGFTLPLEQLLFSFGKNREYVKTTIFFTIFNVIIITIGIKFFGLYSVFLTLILTEICIIVVYCILLKKYFKKDKIIKEISDK